MRIVWKLSFCFSFLDPLDAFSHCFKLTRSTVLEALQEVEWAWFSRLQLLSICITWALPGVFWPLPFVRSGSSVFNAFPALACYLCASGVLCGSRWATSTQHFGGLPKRQGGEAALRAILLYRVAICGTLVCIWTPFGIFWITHTRRFGGGPAGPGDPGPGARQAWARAGGASPGPEDGLALLGYELWDFEP